MSRWLNDPAIRLRGGTGSASPKLRTVTQSHVFHDFLQQNRLSVEGATLVGSLTTGGLSNAWGCGVSAFDADDLKEFPIGADDIAPSMRVVAQRVGLSGRRQDELQHYFGVDEWCEPAFPFDDAIGRLMRRHEARKARTGGVRFGAARNAVLAREKDSRLACNQSGLCMWGCARGSLYSASFDLDRLRSRPSVTHRSGVLVERVERGKSAWMVAGRLRKSSEPVVFGGRKVVLAAGTIATTAIVARSLELAQPIRLFSTPAAAFLVWQPALAGLRPRPTTGFAQASIVATDDMFGASHGNLFSTVNLPASEFLPYIPFSRPLAISMWKTFHASFAVGNVFMEGRFSNLSLLARRDGSITATGGFTADYPAALSALRKKLSRFFRSLGGLLIPGSFIPGAPGSDIHYAGTLPMKQNPARGECSPSGEVAGLEGVYVADAANFTALPAKPHTLTMMANADRIARTMRRNAF